MPYFRISPAATVMREAPRAETNKSPPSEYRYSETAPLARNPRHFEGTTEVTARIIVARKSITGVNGVAEESVLGRLRYHRFQIIPAHYIIQVSLEVPVNHHDDLWNLCAVVR